MAGHLGLGFGQLLRGPGLQPALLRGQLRDPRRPLRLSPLLPGPGFGPQLRLRRLTAGQLARRPLAGRPGRGPAARRRGIIAAAEQGVLRDVGGAGLLDPRRHLGLQQLLQRGDVQPELLRGRVRRHRRVRLDLRAVPGHHVDPDQALPRARYQGLHQQPLVAAPCAGR
jgi:hypothetical protein